MHTGSCLCGQINYEVDDTLEIALNCHCKFCRLAHGAEFVPVALMTADKLRIVKGQNLLSKFEVASTESFRCFCSYCGTRLFNHNPKANYLGLIIATLSTSESVVPLANVNMLSRNMSFQQSNGLPEFDDVPPIEELLELV